MTVACADEVTVMSASQPKPPVPDSLRDAVLERFRKVAADPAGHFDYPTGEEGLRGLGYGHALLAGLPPEVLSCFCGVGNPFLPGLPEIADKVLDLGSGAGVDAIIAARCAAGGLVEGLELCPEMVERARANAALAGQGNVSFRAGDGAALPYADSCFDLVVSNGVFNLMADKPAALAEAFRVLRPGGRLQLADQVLTGQMPRSCPLDGGGSWAR